MHARLTLCLLSYIPIPQSCCGIELMDSGMLATTEVHSQISKIFKKLTYLFIVCVTFVLMYMQVYALGGLLPLPFTGNVLCSPDCS